MQQFSKLKKVDEFKPAKDEVLYSDAHMSVVRYEDWSIIKQKDFVVCVPYLIELNQIVLRHEYVPTFKYADGQEYHLALIGGGREDGETHDVAVVRELEEEAGIVLREDYELEPLKPLFLTKANSTKVYPYIIPLTERDYKEVIAKGDGTKHESMAKAVKVDIKYLSNLESSDVITAYVLMKVKEYLNLTK